MKKLFRVASVSSNSNSFGLKGMILVAADGTAFEVGANYLNVKNVGDFVLYDGSWAKLGFEIPRELPNCSVEVVQEVYKDQCLAV